MSSSEPRPASEGAPVEAGAPHPGEVSDAAPIEPVTGVAEQVVKAAPEQAAGEADKAVGDAEAAVADAATAAPDGVGTEASAPSEEIPADRAAELEASSDESGSAGTVGGASADAAEQTRIPTSGSFEAYTIGEPGRAFTHGISLTETKYRDAHDFVIDAATVPDAEGTPRLVLRAASSRGLSHQQYADPRQDDHCVVLSLDGEWLICLVSDGVSSGEWSHLAAKMVTEEGAAHLIKLLQTHEPHEVPYREVFLALADLLADVCATLPDAEPTVDLTPQDVARRMAATLVIGIIGTRPSEDGTHPVTVVRLGDTSAWILDTDEGWINLGEIKNAGNVIAGSATASLPLVPEEDPVPVQTTLGADAALVLMTDGVGDPLGSGKGDVGRHLAQLWARPPHPFEFAAQTAFGRKTYDDDRGVVAVWLAVPE